MYGAPGYMNYGYHVVEGPGNSLGQQLIKNINGLFSG